MYFSSAHLPLSSVAMEYGFASWMRQSPKAMPRQGDQRESDGRPQPEGREDRLLRCRSCRFPVTSLAFGIEIQGSHGHTFPNPHGIVFRIACFARATGCTRQGTATEAFSWFPGYKWCFALCRNCRTHLGWFYSSTAGRSFFGLITTKLLE